MEIRVTYAIAKTAVAALPYTKKWQLLLCVNRSAIRDWNGSKGGENHWCRIIYCCNNRWRWKLENHFA